MTPGTDGKTLDGFSLHMIAEIIQGMRTEHFQFQPVRTVYIPKANGKMRKLGIPSTRDKIVQEVIRLLLECIYESPQGPYFHDTSHGFRPNRSCHTAFREIRGKRYGQLVLGKEISSRASTTSSTASWSACSAEKFEMNASSISCGNCFGRDTLTCKKSDTTAWQARS